MAGRRALWTSSRRRQRAERAARRASGFSIGADSPLRPLLCSSLCFSFLCASVAGLLSFSAAQTPFGVVSGIGSSPVPVGGRVRMVGWPCFGIMEADVEHSPDLVQPRPY